MKKVLVVTYGGGHVNTVIPLIKMLKADSRYEVDVLGLTTAEKILKLNGIQCFGMRDFADEKIFALGEIFAKKFHSKESGMLFEETCAYYGFGINDLICKYGEEKAREKFEKEGRISFLPVETMKKIIKTVDAKFVITTNSPRTEQAALIAADELGIKALRIQQFYEDAKECSLYKNVFFTVMNEQEKDNFLKLGIKEDRVYVTGQPAFDELSVKSKQFNVENIKSKFKIDKSKKTVLWLTQKTFDEEKILIALLTIFKRRSDLQLIIKLHPNEDKEKHIEICKKFNTDVLVTKQDLHQLICASDLVITEFSTAGLETIFLDKPLLTINLTSKPDIVPYAKSKAAIGVYCEGEIEEAMDRVLNDYNVKESLANGRKNYINDGKAAERVCNLIYNLTCN